MSTSTKKVVAVFGIEIYQALKVFDIILYKGDIFFSMSPDDAVLVDDASVFVFEIVVAGSAGGL